MVWQKHNNKWNRTIKWLGHYFTRILKELFSRQLGTRFEILQRWKNHKCKLSKLDELAHCELTIGNSPLDGNLDKEHQDFEGVVELAKLWLSFIVFWVECANIHVRWTMFGANYIPYQKVPNTWCKFKSKTKFKQAW